MTWDELKIEEALARHGWRSSPSVIEGRRRIYDEHGLLVNVCDAREAIAHMRERGLLDHDREVTTALAYALDQNGGE